VEVTALQVEVNSGGNVYFCFCSSHVGRGQEEGGSVSSDGSPERGHAHAWDERGWHTSISRMQDDCKGCRGGEDSWPEPGSAQQRAASDDSAVRQLVDVLQAAADDEWSASAEDRPAATFLPSGSRNEAVGGHGNDMDSIGSPGPPRGLPSPPSTAAAAGAPDSRAEGSGDGAPQPAGGLQQSCQQEAAQPHPQPDGQVRQDGDSSQAAEHESGNTAQAPQPAHTDAGEPPTENRQMTTLQRQHSGSAPASPDRQHPPDRLLVVKFLPARLDAQSEQFASELARHLGVPSPACRILRKQVAEGKRRSLNKHWSQALQHDTCCVKQRRQLAVTTEAALFWSLAKL
jgi:hypothetical protein